MSLPRLGGLSFGQPLTELGGEDKAIALTNITIVLLVPAQIAKRFNQVTIQAFVQYVVCYIRSFSVSRLLCNCSMISGKVAFPLRERKRGLKAMTKTSARIAVITKYDIDTS